MAVLTWNNSKVNRDFCETRYLCRAYRKSDYVSWSERYIEWEFIELRGQVPVREIVQFFDGRQQAFLSAEICEELGFVLSVEEFLNYRKITPFLFDRLWQQASELAKPRLPPCEIVLTQDEWNDAQGKHNLAFCWKESIGNLLSRMVKNARLPRL